MSLVHSIIYFANINYLHQILHNSLINIKDQDHTKSSAAVLITDLLATDEGPTPTKVAYLSSDYKLIPMIVPNMMPQNFGKAVTYVYRKCHKIFTITVKVTAY